MVESFTINYRTNKGQYKTVVVELGTQKEVIKDLNAEGSRVVSSYTGGFFQQTQNAFGTSSPEYQEKVYEAEGFGTPTSLPQTTKTEEALQMSLPSNLRNVPVENFYLQQSLPFSPYYKSENEYATKILAKENPEKQMTEIIGYETSFNRTVPSYLPKTPKQIAEEKGRRFEETSSSDIFRRTYRGIDYLGSELRVQTLKLPPVLEIEKFNDPLYRTLVKYPPGSLIIGGYKEVRSNPNKILITAGAFAVLPTLLQGFGSGTKLIGIGKVTSIFPKTSNFLNVLGGGVITAGALGFYGYSVYTRVKAQPTINLKGQEIGKILTGEIIPAEFGFSSGVNFAQRFTGFFRTLGKTEIAAEKIIEPKVLSGEKNFPTISKNTNPLTLREEFKLSGKIQSRYGLPDEVAPEGFNYGGYTGSVTSFSKVTSTKAGTSEFEGLYQAPTLSAYFLKLQGSGYYNKIPTLADIFSPIGSPTVIRGYLKEVELVPGVNPRATNINQPIPKSFKEFFKTDAELGKGYIPFAKTEKELIITKGTTAERISYDYFVNYKGVRVPIPQYKFYGDGKVSGKGGLTTAGELSSKYYYPETRALYPYSFSFKSYYSKLFFSKNYYSSASSSKVSSVISKVSYPNISKLSYNPQSYSQSYSSRSVYSPPSYLNYYTNSYNKGTSSRIRYNTRITTLPPPTIFALPRDIDQRRKRRRMRVNAGSVLRYTPSLTAQLFNIKAYKVPKNVETALVIRPIIVPRGRR